MSLVWLCECGKGRTCTENALDHILCPQEGSWCCSTSPLLPTSAPSCRMEGSLASVAGVSAAGIGRKWESLTSWVGDSGA